MEFTDLLKRQLDSLDILIGEVREIKAELQKPAPVIIKRVPRDSALSALPKEELAWCEDCKVNVPERLINKCAPHIGCARETLRQESYSVPANRNNLIVSREERIQKLETVASYAQVLICDLMSGKACLPPTALQRALREAGYNA